jgi:hypothetical protein
MDLADKNYARPKSNLITVDLGGVLPTGTQCKHPVGASLDSEALVVALKTWLPKTQDGRKGALPRSSLGKGRWSIIAGVLGTRRDKPGGDTSTAARLETFEL